MPHDRREAPWRGRVDDLAPGLLLVLRRGAAKQTSCAPCDPDQAAKYLVAGTYMAGELRRYWAFASTMALGTGVGEAHPASITSLGRWRLVCHVGSSRWVNAR